MIVDMCVVVTNVLMNLFFLGDGVIELCCRCIRNGVRIIEFTEMTLKEVDGTTFTAHHAIGTSVQKTHRLLSASIQR